MHIRIKSEDVNLSLHLPNGLVLNRLAVGILSGMLQRRNVPISGQQLAGFVQEVRACRKRLGPWKLVQIQTKDGQRVELTL